MEHHSEQHETVGYNTHILIWLSLLILTGLTVTVAGLELGAWSMTVALLIATSKVVLVLLYFMHLKYESPFVKLIVLIVLVSIVTFIVFTFFDVSFR